MKKKSIGKNGFILLGIIIALVLIVLFFSSGVTTKKVDIEKLSDLNGKKVGVQSATLYEEGLLEKAPDAKVVFYSDPFTMLMSLEQRKLDAAVIESVTFQVEKVNYPTLTLLEEVVSTIPICAGFGETDNTELLASQFEEFLEQSREDGTLEEMDEYWLSNYSENCKVDKSGITGENGVIKIAVETSYEPYEYVSNGEYQGYDIDLAFRFARQYGYTPEIIGLDFDAIAPALTTGKYDIGLNLIAGEERSDVMKFSSPYTHTDIQVAIVDNNAVVSSDTNIFESIAESFNKTFIVEGRWKLFVQGLAVTLLICLISIIIGFILGVLAYMLCYDGDKLANVIMKVFCEIFGGLPSVVLLMIMYYVLLSKLTIGNVAVSVVTFSFMFTSCVFSVIRTGVEALGIGQYEAARAQGFDSKKTFFKIILPQVLINQLPTLQDEVGSLIKETSIVGYIAVTDLTKMSDVVRGRTYEPFFPLIVTAIIYYLLIKALAFLASKMMGKIKIESRHAEKKIAKLNDSEGIKPE